MLQIQAILIGATLTTATWGRIITNWGSYYKSDQVYYKSKQLLQIINNNIALSVTIRMAYSFPENAGVCFNCLKSNLIKQETSINIKYS